MKQATLFLLLITLTVTARGQEYSAEQLKYFETHIRPALVKYCYDCHSVDAGDSRAGLLVDTREGLMQGGDSGPAIVPGNHADSLLWEAITWEGYEMPPSQQMPASVIDKFKTWIDMGAPDPRVRETLEFKTKITKDDIEQGRSHWAFQPPQPQAGQDIDSLVAAGLAESGLQPTRAADAFTLLRRLNFDIVGLPPTPSEIEVFADAFKVNPDAAVSSKVDELLARPQFGERWGRHWLDVARYAESSGSRNVSYPHAWRYRDYVIDAFNNDTHYDQFIKEQIAGDLLPAKTDEQWQNNLIATGFLAIGMKHHDEKNPRKFMSDMVDEQIDTTTQAVLGLTVACARCHDHKYDPIPTDDYYRLAGIFYSTKTYYGTTRIGQNHRPSDLLLLPVQDGGTPAARGGRTQSMASIQQRIDELDRQMRGVAGKDRRNLRNSRNRLVSQLQSLNPDGTAKAFGMGVQENGEMINASILLGGEVDKPAQEVQRGFVQVLGDLDFAVSSRRESGRLELAEALTSKDNPLTARVMMNRVWMHLLGSPLVETTSNFGLSGTAPTHPELLDHLAVRFMAKDWDVKAMIREIVMSKTYRRSSQYVVTNYEEDPDNKLLWRANPRQVDAEVLRDAMLALSGQLSAERPGGSVLAGMGGRPGSVNLPDNTYRSIYLPVVRDNLPESLDLFDFPDPNMSSTGRNESIVPTQALYLMNGEFVQAQASAMAAALQQQSSSREEQVRTAFLWAYSRPATSEELQASVAFFREFVPTAQGTPISIEPAAGPRGRAGRAGQAAGRGMAGGGRPGGRDPGMNREQGMNRGGAGPRGRRGPGGRTAAGRGRGGVSAAATSDQALAVFCQTLMASARFRILN
ncbi:MAG: PSD1 and planctomycete cytochrome C domain-containing protein [Planctomycetaceae bacterium]|nr:PSD1 and planctomycete cytochrome C domain-containing protein [Planctomycetaceae bacterium]